MTTTIDAYPFLVGWFLANLSDADAISEADRMERPLPGLPVDSASAMQSAAAAIVRAEIARRTGSTP